jgi:hypothetical protein
MIDPEIRRCCHFGGLGRRTGEKRSKASSDDFGWRNKAIGFAKNKIDNETSVEANDFVSLFIDICYIFMAMNSHVRSNSCLLKGVSL